MAEGKFDLNLAPVYNETTSVMDWLERVDLICKHSGVDKVEQVIPLRLARGAFVYQQLQMTLGISQCLADRQHKMEKPQNYPCNKAHAGGCQWQCTCVT